MSNRKKSVKKVIRNVILEIHYPAKYFPDYDDRIHKIVGLISDYSGLGFGQRELGFSLPADQRALAIGKLQSCDLDGLTFGSFDEK